MSALPPEMVAAHVEATRARRVAEGKPAHLSDPEVLDRIARIVARRDEGHGHQTPRPSPKQTGRSAHPAHRTERTP